MSKADFFLSMFKGDIEELCLMIMWAAENACDRGSSESIETCRKWLLRIDKILKVKDICPPENWTYYMDELGGPNITKSIKFKIWPEEEK